MNNRILRSLFWFLLSFGLTIWAGLVNAATQTPQWQYKYLAQDPWVNQLELVCQQLLAAAKSGGDTSYFSDDYSTECAAMEPPNRFQTKGYIISDPRRYSLTWRTQFSKRQWCIKSNVAPVNGVCPDIPDEPPPPPPGTKDCSDKNPFIRTWIYGPKGPYVPPADFGGCSVVPEKMLVCRKASATTTQCMWQVRRTGEPYTGPENKADGTSGTDTPDKSTEPPVKSPPITNTDKTPENSPCPAGTVHAGADSSGIPMCIGMGTDPKQTPPTTAPKIETSKDEQQADGSTKNTKTTTTTNSDGSTTTTTVITITRPDGSRDVTQTNPVTSTTPSGGEGKQDKPEEQSDLCKLNPMLTICRNSSVTGSCGQISCQGDAIQCATLRAAAAMECRQRQDVEDLKASPLTAIGQAAIDGKDTQSLPNPKNAQVVNLPGVEAQGWLGNGAPFRDISFSVQGHQIVVPIAEWVEYLLPLRYALMIVASLVSFRILGGAILRE